MRPAAEIERVMGEALPPARLAQIWRMLDERERFGFLLSLDEMLVEQVLILTMPARPAETEGTDHGT